MVDNLTQLNQNLLSPEEKAKIAEELGFDEDDFV